MYSLRHFATLLQGNVCAFLFFPFFRICALCLLKPETWTRDKETIDRKSQGYVFSSPEPFPRWEWSAYFECPAYLRKVLTEPNPFTPDVAMRSAYVILFSFIWFAARVRNGWKQNAVRHNEAPPSHDGLQHARCVFNIHVLRQEWILVWSTPCSHYSGILQHSLVCVATCDCSNYKGKNIGKESAGSAGEI